MHTVNLTMQTKFLLYFSLISVIAGFAIARSIAMPTVEKVRTFVLYSTLFSVLILVVQGVSPEWEMFNYAADPPYDG